MYELVRLIQFELFCVAVDCFWYGFVRGYDHIEWKGVKNEQIRPYV